MQTAGIREVGLARADGRRDAAYEGQRAMRVPDDPAAALAVNEATGAFFATLSGVNR